MSDLSVFLNRVGAFFRTPQLQATPGVSDAAQKVTDAATAVEGVLPALAKVAADAALATAGPLGVTATPFVNGFIDMLVAELQSRKAVVPAQPSAMGTTGLAQQTAAQLAAPR